MFETIRPRTIKNLLFSLQKIYAQNEKKMLSVIKEITRKPISYKNKTGIPRPGNRLINDLYLNDLVK